MLEKPDLMLTNASVFAPGSDCHRSTWIIAKKGCISGFGKTVSEATVFPSETVINEGWTGKGKIEWHRLAWEQNPTQYHIVNALADLPIIEYLPAFVTKGSTNLFVPDRLPRALR